MMDSSPIEIAFDNHCGLGEGPVWDSIQNRLYWVDIDNHLLFCGDPITHAYQQYPFTFAVTALGIRRNGGLVLATSHGFVLWNSIHSEFEQLGDPESDKSGARFNDGAVDRVGRFWAGTMTETDATSTLYRLDAQHRIQPMEKEITISNGMGWSPDNRFFYFTDTLRKVIYRYDFDLQSGKIENRTIFISVFEGPGLPDGLTIDQEGFIWSARCGGGKIVRYDPTGKIEREILTPVSSPTSITFGGNHLKQLFITTSSSLVNPTLRLEDTLAGCTFCFTPGVDGLPETFYEG